MIEIITYQEKYKADFIRLNTEWIETWFWLEESDRKTFATVDSYIIGNGGQIFLALDTDSEEVVGCCALINHPEKESYELAKMAVFKGNYGKETATGRKAGSSDIFCGFVPGTPWGISCPRRSKSCTQ